MSFSVLECADFSAFQDAIKNMRKLDDIIVNTLNTVVPTDSFQTNGTNACKELHTKIVENNKARTEAIRDCISISAERIKKYKETREINSDDAQLSKALRSEQTKLRMLQVELTVEDLVHQRSTKVFNEKCRHYFRSNE